MKEHTNTIAIVLGAVAITLSITALCINTQNKQKNHHKRGMHVVHHYYNNQPMHMMHIAHANIPMHKLEKLKQMKRKSPEEKFNLIDTNKDGTITKQEWKNHFEKYKKHHKPENKTQQPETINAN
tara:strand:+ start:1048 stop:1422 length:375 start_codon:yes stop_codon:yes gene_type:complete